MITRALLGSLVAVITLGSGCSSEATGADEPLVVDEGCQGLLATTSRETTFPSGCLVPFPSDAYREPDPATSTGFRIALRGAARPKRTSGDIADPTASYVADGFSVASTLVVTLPGVPSREGLPGVFDDLSASTRADGPSMILEADTGAFVAHYVDVHDRSPEGQPRPIVLRAIAPLKPRTRYVVALSGVKDEAGGLSSPGEGFRRLRDRTGDAALANVAPRFETEIFGPLERAGVRREALQLAWDFTTGSEEEPRRQMLHVRELTLAWLGSNVPSVKVTKVEDGKGHLWKKVFGELTVPLFLDVPGVGSRLALGPDGLAVQNGTATVPFTITIPVSVRDTIAPARALAYGHGFFGTQDELEGDAAATVGDTLGAVEFGIDWWGMSKPDLDGVVKNASTNIAEVASFAERVHQAMANWLVLTAAIRGPLTKLPELQRTTGELVYDPSFVSYFGPSLGHILGGTLAALSTDFSRVVLGVGGGGWTHIMPRSGNFGPFSVIVGASFDDPVVVQAVLAMMQRALDRIDPVVYAPLVMKEPLPGSPPDRRVLMQIALGDNAVPNVASFLHARALGLSQTVPSPKPVFGLPTTPGGEASSAITLFDFGIDTSGSTLPLPLTPNGAHDGLRTTKGALRQMDAFLKPGGVVVHPCDGPCDPD